MVRLSKRFALLLCIFLLIGNASAQDQDQVLRTQTTVVLAPTLVKDVKGKLIFGLRAGDFTIEDDGVEQAVQLDEILDAQPVSVVIALQCGGAAPAEFERMKGLGAMLGPVLEQGNTDVAIVEFDSKVALTRDFTRDEKAIRNDLRRLRPGDGGAAILDAVNYSVAMLNKTPNDRLRMLLLISETRDHGSAVPLANVATAMAGSDIVMYALAFSPALSAVLDDARGKNPGKANNADLLAPILMATQGMRKNIPKAIAAMTGGQYELFKSGKNFEFRMNQFDNDLYNRYLLSFQPSDPHPGLHKVEVKLSTPRKHASVAARNSYWAAPPPRSRGIRESETR
ncbi:MAG TPA: VWA domain-containing protein [Terriglobia bacterium]|jgi:VWFA-related protein